MAVGGMIWKQGDRWFGVVVSDEGVVWLDWSSKPERLEKKLKNYPPVEMGAAARRNLERVRREINEYVAGKRKRFTVPVAPEGTDFQKSVWEALCKIPYGKSMSYGELAKQLGKPGAARAVGSAAGKNPVPIIIPCHRLIPTNCKLGGFSAGEGIEDKKMLLELEGIEWEGE
jgi:methylated-DNA-[protein]-cysteine S-methyltransferase